MSGSTAAEFVKNPDEFADAHEYPYVDVPIQLATAENLTGYGWIVNDFDKEEVVRMTWPRPGWRQYIHGTGNQQSIIEDDFDLYWVGDVLHGDSIGLGKLGSGFTTGRLDKESTSQRRRHVLVKEANYHPDGGQVFFPKSSSIHPFVLLLAPSTCGDDITPADFKAFAFDGTQGFQIGPNVWHSSPFIADDKLTFRNKQTSVFGCISVDTVKEFGTYLRIPLAL